MAAEYRGYWGMGIITPVREGPVPATSSFRMFWGVGGEGSWGWGHCGEGVVWRQRSWGCGWWGRRDGVGLGRWWAWGGHGDKMVG